MKYNSAIKNIGYTISIILVFFPIILNKMNNPLAPNVAKVGLVLGLIVAAATKIYSLSKNREKVRVSTAIIDFVTSIGLLGLAAWVLFF